MTTTISDGTTTVTLSDDLLQEGEHGWSPVQQATTHTLTGALWVDVSIKQAGRPITLAGGADPDGCGSRGGGLQLPRRRRRGEAKTKTRQGG